MYKNIAVAYDESPEACRALTTAIRLAKTLGIGLRTITVMEKLPAYTGFATSADPSLTVVLEEDRGKYYEQMQAGARAAGQREGVEVITHVVDGEDDRCNRELRLPAQDRSACHRDTSPIRPHFAHVEHGVHHCAECPVQRAGRALRIGLICRVLCTDAFPPSPALNWIARRQGCLLRQCPLRERPLEKPRGSVVSQSEIVLKGHDFTGCGKTPAECFVTGHDFTAC